MNTGSLGCHESVEYFANGLAVSDVTGLRKQHSLDAEVVRVNAVKNVHNVGMVCTIVADIGETSGNAVFIRGFFLWTYNSVGINAWFSQITMVSHPLRLANKDYRNKLIESFQNHR